jgi:hypothetical protein
LPVIFNLVESLHGQLSQQQSYSLNKWCRVEPGKRRYIAAGTNLLQDVTFLGVPLTARDQRQMAPAREEEAFSWRS